MNDQIPPIELELMTLLDRDVSPEQRSDLIERLQAHPELLAQYSEFMHLQDQASAMTDEPEAWVYDALMTEARRETAKVNRRRRLENWFGWILQPAVAAPATVCLAFLVGYQLLDSSPQIVQPKGEKEVTAIPNQNTSTAENTLARKSELRDAPTQSASASSSEVKKQLRAGRALDFTDELPGTTPSLENTAKAVTQTTSKPAEAPPQKPATAPSRPRVSRSVARRSAPRPVVPRARRPRRQDIPPAASETSGLAASEASGQLDQSAQTAGGQSASRKALEAADLKAPSSRMAEAITSPPTVLRGVPAPRSFTRGSSRGSASMPPAENVEQSTSRGAPLSNDSRLISTGEKQAFNQFVNKLSDTPSLKSIDSNQLIRMAGIAMQLEQYPKARQWLMHVIQRDDATNAKAAKLLQEVNLRSRK